MVISTSASQNVVYGNGSTNVFNYNFIAGTASNVQVFYTDATGNITTLAPTQYTLFINPAATGQLWGIGGTVTYPLSGSPIANGSNLLIRRIVPLTQSTSISNQGDFYPQTVESALDVLCMEIQQVSSRTGQFRGTWISGILYNPGDYVIDGAAGANTQNYYSAANANTSGVWATDLANGFWILTINVAQFNANVAASAAAASTATTAATSASASASTASTAGSAATAAATTASTAASTASTAATTASSAATTASTGATTATTQAGIATTAATSASASAAMLSAGLSATSATSLTIGTGSKTFVTQASKLFTVGEFLQIASNANPVNYMHGLVSSYSGTSLVMNITDVGGSGTFADWIISISGPAGVSGTGSGTVTSVSVVTANGVSASVANATTTPAITVTLGAITPTTIVASGSVTGANLSGTNTGDQTNITGNAATVTTNANTTGDVTSVGNVTTIKSNVALSGNPTTTTQAALTNNTRIATTAYVDAAVALISTSAFPSAIAGLLPTSITGSSTTAAVNISTGKATDSTAATILSKTAGTWSVANGNAINGYSGGSTLPTLTTIHFFVCSGGSGTGYFASNALTPTFPTGYATYSRRIFSLITDSSGNLLSGVATEIFGGGMEFDYAAVITDLNNSATTTVSRTLTAMSVPSGIKLVHKARFCTAGAGVALITSPDESDSAAVGNTTNPGEDMQNGTGSTQAIPLEVKTNISAQIGIRTSNGIGMFAFTRGFKDYRIT